MNESKQPLSYPVGTKNPPYGPGKEYVFHVPFTLAGDVDTVMNKIVWEIGEVLLPWLKNYFMVEPGPVGPGPKHPKVISFAKAKSLLRKKFRG